MLQKNRAIDRGYGSARYASVSLKAAFTAAADLRPVNGNTMSTMQPSQKPNDFLPPVPAVINTDAIAGGLSDFCRPTVAPISGSPWEPLWDRWVSRHHY